MKKVQQLDLHHPCAIQNREHQEFPTTTDATPASPIFTVGISPGGIARCDSNPMNVCDDFQVECSALLLDTCSFAGFTAIDLPQQGCFFHNDVLRPAEALGRAPVVFCDHC